MQNKKALTYILGGGVTGLAAGMASGLTIFEAAASPGGICSSYYMKKGGKKRLAAPPPDDEAYRFELGGGHWIFGCDPILLNFFEKFTQFKKYDRKASVYFPELEIYADYPIQKNLKVFGEKISAVCSREMRQASGKPKSMKEWLMKSFGKTLCGLFFFPFHERYTSGLYKKIAPQDEYKSPASAKTVKEKTGYNPSYFYPKKGLSDLCLNLARGCRIKYGKKVVRIDPAGKKVYFQDGSQVKYEALISTLPLNRTMELAGLNVSEKPEPFTSVLVLNLGVVPGKNCPSDHWVYVPKTRSGFYRVGFYSNVDVSFLPKFARRGANRAALYVERSYANGKKPTEKEIQKYTASVIRELKSWGWVEEVEVSDPTWVDVAYTWSYPSSSWKGKAMKALESHHIFPLGRYGRWHFQGIADSIRDGLWAGEAMKKGRIGYA